MTAEAGGPVAPERDQNIPRSYYLDPAGEFRRDLPLREMIDVVRERRGALWVDIDSGNRHQFALLEKLFAFHPLSIEDCLNPNSRVKVEEYDGYLFVIIRGIRFIPETEDPYDTETFNLYFYLLDNILVTVHGESSSSIAAVAGRVHQAPDLLGRGAQRLMHAIMDAAIDAYFPILDQIDEFIGGLEERVFASFDQEVLRDIFSVKQVVVSLRRHLLPQREIFNMLTNRPSALLNRETQLYFRDIYDHILRINDVLETQRELLSSTMDSYLTQISNRLGAVTKALSTVATLSIPFVVVSGMWGMNFARIPLSEHPYGFWIMLLVQLAFGVLLVWALRRARLL